MSTSDPQTARTGPSADEPAQGGDFDSPRVVLHETLTLERMFTQREADLIEDLVRFAHEDREGCGRSLMRAIDEGGRRLGALALAIESYPSLLDVTTLGSKQRSLESLARTLEESGGHATEWALPTKAVLARAYGIAKVNFWTSIAYVVQTTESPEGPAMMGAIEEAIDEAVFTRLAEELYGSFAASRDTEQAVRQVAINQVIDLWEGRIGFATYRFCPILRSAWAARTHAPRVFGTMMGAQELMTLLFADCDSRFVDVFAARADDEDVVHAFEEFLFDLPYESLEFVRQRMAEEGKTVVGPQQVAEYLDLGELRPRLAGAKALYSSFRRRRTKAQYRTSMRAPGPKRTAESYVLEALLRANLEKPGSEPRA